MAEVNDNQMIQRSLQSKLYDFCRYVNILGASGLAVGAVVSPDTLESIKPLNELTLSLQSVDGQIFSRFWNSAASGATLGFYGGVGYYFGRGHGEKVLQTMKNISKRIMDEHRNQINYLHKYEFDSWREKFLDTYQHFIQAVSGDIKVAYRSLENWLKSGNKQY